MARGWFGSKEAHRQAALLGWLRRKTPETKNKRLYREHIKNDPKHAVFWRFQLRLAQDADIQYAKGLIAQERALQELIERNRK